MRDKETPALACWGYGWHAPAATRFYSSQLVADNGSLKLQTSLPRRPGVRNGVRRRIGDVLKHLPGCIVQIPSRGLRRCSGRALAPGGPWAGAGGRLGADHFPLVHPSGRMGCSIESAGRGNTMGLVDKVKDLVGQAREKAGPLLKQASEKAGPLLKQAKEKAGPLVEQAKEKAGPLVEQAKEKAGPLVEQAKEKAGPLVEQAKEKAGPLLKETDEEGAR